MSSTFISTSDAWIQDAVIQQHRDAHHPELTRTEGQYSDIMIVSSVWSHENLGVIITDGSVNSVKSVVEGTRVVDGT